MWVEVGNVRSARHQHLDALGSPGDDHDCGGNFPSVSEGSHDPLYRPTACSHPLLCVGLMEVESQVKLQIVVREDLRFSLPLRATTFHFLSEQ